MTHWDFMDHLSSETQEDIMFVMTSDSYTYEMKADLISLSTDDQLVIEKCRNILEAEKKLTSILEYVTEESREMVRSVIIDQDLTQGQKVRCLLKEGRGFTERLLKFLKEYVPPSAETQLKKEEALLPPEIPEWSYSSLLNSLPPETHEDVKMILGETALANVEKLEHLYDIVEGKEERRECRHFLRTIENEMALLNSLPKETQGEVATILRETCFSLEEKRELLRFILKDKEDRKRCRKYLKKIEPKNEVNETNTEEEEEEEDKLPELNTDFLRKSSDTMNILILGETGVGKSTFINGIANYLKFRTMIDAKNSNDVEVLISSHFSLTQDNMEARKIVCKSEDDCGNENLMDGKSSTLADRTYVFRWSLRGRKKQIRLIDTPGVGDVDGFERDRKNFDSIFSHLADLKELHGICVLMKPNESKLNMTFTYCLGELLSRLHISARETLAILQVYMKQLEEERNIQVPLNRASVFCFDNESFRFLCAWKEKVQFNDRHIRDFGESWERSVVEVFRFFNRVSQLIPHNVADTLCVNNVRIALNIMTKPMAVMSKKQQDIDKVIQEKENEILQFQADIAKEQNNIQRNQTTTQRVQSGRIDTVCTADRCSPFDPDNVAEKRYKICHQNCGCVRAKDTKLQQCACMNRSTLMCNTCGCLWTCHLQIDYELKRTTQQVTDEIVQKKIQSLQDKVVTTKNVIADAQKRKADTGNENQRLLLAGSEFVAYLKKNALLPINTNMKEYISKLIDEEVVIQAFKINIAQKGKVGQGNSDKELTLLKAALDAYEQQVGIFSACTQDSSKTVDDMDSTINDLQNDLNGPLHKEFSSMEILKVRAKPIMRSKVVDLNYGWIGDIVL